MYKNHNYIVKISMKQLNQCSILFPPSLSTKQLHTLVHVNVCAMYTK